MFMVFAGFNYYLSGGVSDLVGTAGSLHEARAMLPDNGEEWAQISEIGFGIVIRTIDYTRNRKGKWIEGHWTW